MPVEPLPTGKAWLRSKHPAPVLAGTYGSPIHPLIVPIPIAAWLISLILDIVSRLTPAGQIYYLGSCWLMGIGVLGAFGAAAAGLIDYGRLPGGSRIKRIATTHMTINLVVATAYLINFVLRWAWQPGDGTLRAGLSANSGVPFWLILLSAVSFACLSASGYLGSLMAYRYGVRVTDEATQKEAYSSRQRFRTLRDLKREL